MTENATIYAHQAAFSLLKAYALQEDRSLNFFLSEGVLSALDKLKEEQPRLRIKALCRSLVQEHPEVFLFNLKEMLFVQNLLRHITDKEPRPAEKRSGSCRSTWFKTLISSLLENVQEARSVDLPKLFADWAAVYVGEMRGLEAPAMASRFNEIYSLMGNQFGFKVRLTKRHRPRPPEQLSLPLPPPSLATAPTPQNVRTIRVDSNVTLLNRKPFLLKTVEASLQGIVRVVKNPHQIDWKDISSSALQYPISIGPNGELMVSSVMYLDDYNYQWVHTGFVCAPGKGERDQKELDTLIHVESEGPPYATCFVNKMPLEAGIYGRFRKCLPGQVLDQLKYRINFIVTPDRPFSKPGMIKMAAGHGFAIWDVTDEIWGDFIKLQNRRPPSSLTPSTNA